MLQVVLRIKYFFKYFNNVHLCSINMKKVDFSDNQIIVIDTGFSTTLRKHVTNEIDGHPLWSALFNLSNPEAVKQTHLDFLNAGAQLIRTNTYQASIEGYEKHAKLSNKESIELIKKTVRLAHLARDEYLKQNTDVEIPLVSGSIGPYGAFVHDGSEYTGVYGKTVDKDVLKKWHRDRIQAIVEVGIDALAVETLPCLIEAEALTELICDEYPNVKFWISFQCKDFSSIASGEKFSDCALAIWKIIKDKNAQNNFLAIGMNCTNPKFVNSLFESVNKALSGQEKIPFVVYANSGEIYDVEHGWSGKSDCQPLETYVPKWIELGVRFVGGCCRTYPDNITRFRQIVKNFK